MRRIHWSFIIAGLMVLTLVAPAMAQDTVTIDMREVEGSGQSGLADITSDGDQVTVLIEITPGEEGVPQPAHIHDGSCNDLGGVAYPLDDVVDGVSESNADVSIAELIGGEYAINVHLSADEMGVHVACGTLPLIRAAAPAEEEDDAEEVTEEDDAVEEDDAAEDDAVTEDEADDEDVVDVAPAAGSTDGMNTATAMLFMALLASAALGVGVAVRRREIQA